MLFELNAAREYNDSDQMNDRTVFTLTGTRNLLPGMSLTAGLVWANKPEFRGEVDQELSARLGLNYKLSMDR